MIPAITTAATDTSGTGCSRPGVPGALTLPHPVSWVSLPSPDFGVLVAVAIKNPAVISQTTSRTPHLFFSLLLPKICLDERRCLFLSAVKAGRKLFLLHWNELEARDELLLG